jgi:hypothetical protein
VYLCTRIQPVSPFRSDGRKTKHKIKRFSCMICDQCSSRFEHRYHNRWKQQSLHFCSKKCTDIAKSKGGLVRAIVERTCIERLGAPSPFEAEASKLKMQKTWLKNYGVDNPSKSVIIHEKRCATTLKNFGVVNPLQSPIVRQRSKETSLLRYGVEYPMQHPSIQRRGRLTAMKNGTKSWSSHIENRFYEFLCHHFESNDIERQTNINGWSIDFFVKSIETYIQFDGVYWHGHIHDQITLETATTPQLKSIYHAWKQDQVQNAWFSAKGLRLVRITDREFTSPQFDLMERLK